MSTSRSLRVLAATMTFLALAGLGCTKTRTITENGVTIKTSGNLDQEGGTGKATFTNEDGTTGTVEVRGAGEHPPEGFPKEFPVMRGMEALNYTSYTQDGGLLYGGEWSTKSSIADVYAFYKKELPQNGWSVLTTSTYNDSSFISFSKKGDQRYAGTVSMEKEADGNTNVSMSLIFSQDMGGLAQ